MSLTKVSYPMIQGAPINVMAYGASPSASAAVNTAAIQAAIDAGANIYIPAGTYLINDTLTIGEDTMGNKRIFGDGSRNTILKGTTATSGLKNKVQHYWIQLENFGFDGDNLANVGLSLGIPSGAVGTTAYDYLTDIAVTNCNTIALELNSAQYVQINQCVFQGTTNGHGIKAQTLLTSSISNSTVIDNKYGMYIGNYGGAVGSLLVTLNNVQFFGPVVGISPEWYLAVDGAYGVWLNGCVFENERVFNNPLVIVNNTNVSLVTANIYFNDCIWQGLAYAQNLIQIIDGNRIYFNECRAIRPSAGSYILNQASIGEVFVNNCLAGTGYSDYATYYWSDGGFINGPVYETQEPNSYLNITDGVTEPTTVLGRAYIYVDVADGDLKVKFGDGTIKTIATDT